MNKSEFVLIDRDVKELFENAAKQGIFKSQEYKMISNIFELKDTTVKNILIPQTDVEAVSININVFQLLEVFQKTSFSRLPVYEKERDNIIGAIYAKELINADFEKVRNLKVKDLVHKIIFVPESKTINTLLQKFQKEKIHMVAVIDEFGVFSGIVTIEDILEEIVGEIQDEFDEEENLITKINEKEFVVLAKIDIEELNETLNIELPELEEYESLAGFLIYIKDDLPVCNEVIKYNGYEFEVLNCTKKRILKVKLKINGE
jgi:CBS domain containing-hemolysin-like protein